MTTAPDQQPTPTPARHGRRWLRPQPWWPFAAGVIVGIAFRLIFSGAPGHPFDAMLVSFVVLGPLLVGVVTVYVAERIARRSWPYYFWAGAGANVLFIVGTFVIVIEGAICALAALPLFVIIGGLSGILMGAICRWTRRPRRAVYSFALLPLLLGSLEQKVPLPAATQVVTRSTTIAASPDKVWAQLVAPVVGPTQMQDAWLYRIGVPPTQSAITQELPHEVVRRFRMGKGIHFEQVAADWQPGKRVRWQYRFSPDSFPPRALDDHVRIGGEYFDLIAAEFSLEAVPTGTVLRMAMSYRVSTHFNWYAQPLAALLIGDFEQRALSFYKARTEQAPARP